MSSVACPSCDTQYSSSAVACPNCQRLVHGEQLKALAAKAEVARKEGDAVGERLLWRETIPLLPIGSKQRLSIENRVSELESATRSEPVALTPEKPPSWASGGGVMGAVALVLWKIKGVLLFGLGKLKFLTLGLSKASTLFSFLASFGVYWSLWGWRFALGFLVAMYIHEMGHVAALIRYGIPASAPMFVPGLGAFVRMDKHPATTGEDARIGLAGPEWGFAAALASYAMYALTAAPIWAAIGHSAAFLNLFNLLPLWQLDGGRGFAALTRGQRLIIAVAFAAGWAITHQGLFGLLFVVAVYRAFADGATRGDVGVLGRFTTLIAVFAAMLLLGQPNP